MADVKWIKITTDIFDDEKVLLIESLPEADSIIVIWFKLLCLAGKINNSGVFMMNDKVAYTDKMLAAIFRRKETTVKMALDTFERFGMIEIIDDVITIPNWGKHQNLDSIESKRNYQREYMREYREKQKHLVCKTNSKANSKTNSKANVSRADNNISNSISSSNSDSYINNITKIVNERNYSVLVNNKVITWLLYKKEKKQPYKPIGLTQLLNKIDKKILEYSEEDVCWVIDECMEKNYQGIIWDLLEKKDNKNTGSAYMDAIKNRVSQVDECLPQDSIGKDSIDKDSIEEKKKTAKRFTPPTVDEVRAYCQERHNGIDPETFVDFYSSKGWKVGSNPMKDWKAAVRTWEKRNKKTEPEVPKNDISKLKALENYYINQEV